MKTLFFLVCTFLCAQTEPSTPLVIGKKYTISSSVLGENKEIYISLPHKYDERVHSYPIIFVLEAEFLFNSASNIAHFMAARSKMPQSIIVGLANGEYKKRNELTFRKWNGIPEKYIEFFNKELIPHIESNYRANKHRTLVGLSPTTGFVIEAMLDHPKMFNAYILLSAHFEWQRSKNNVFVDELIAKTSEKNYPNVPIYFSRADSDLNDMKEVKRSFEEASEKIKKAKNIKANIVIDVLKDEEHYLMALAGLRNGFKHIYPNHLWRNPGIYGWDKAYDYAGKYYKSYYDDLSKRYGFDIYPVEDGHAYGFHLTGMIHNAKRWGTEKQTVDLIHLGLTYYPNSAHLNMLLAEYYAKKNKLTEAKEYAEKAVELVKLFNPSQLNTYLEKQNAF